MKRILAMAFAASWLVACSDNNSAENSTVNDGSDAPISSPAPSATYTASEGDVTYRDDKVLVYRNNDWVEADKDVTLENGVVVYRDGRVKRDDKEVKLEDGEVVNKTGDFFDRTGNAIEKGWNDVKDASKEMGKDIEKGANKVGDKAEKAAHDDHDSK